MPLREHRKAPSRVCIAVRADTVVSTTASKERGADPAVSSNSMSATATKDRADTAVSSTSSGKRPRDEHTTACERNPQKERRQPSQTPQHRTTHPEQQSKTRAETAVSNNSSGNHRPSNAQRRVPTSRTESGQSYARHRSLTSAKHPKEGNRANISVYRNLTEYTMACARN